MRYSIWLQIILAALCIAGALASFGAAAQQAGEKLTLRPAAGLSTITLYKAEAGAELRKVPAQTLDGTFVVLQASSTGWLKLKLGNDAAWVDGYDVEVKRAVEDCVPTGLAQVPDQNRTGLAQRCGK